MKFVSTGEPSLLGSAIQELQKVTEEGNPKEDLYLSRLVCSRQTIGADIHLSVSKAIFTSASAWCDDKLQDYHLHFGKVSSRSVITSEYVHNFADSFQIFWLRLLYVYLVSV